ncbi:MAG: ASKHA domain-containing protein [Pseudomonadota bacterium]|nr:ASKHA domain-containing protein [Pseudomonadota bacterium]
MAAGKTPPSASTNSARVVWLPAGKHGAAALGRDLLDLAREQRIDLDSVCGGRGLCGRCQVDLPTGDFAKFQLRSTAAHVSPPSAAESRFAARHGWPPERRLACQTRLRGDVVVDVPAGSQIHKQVIVKELNAGALTVDPLLRLYFVTVLPADLATPRGDFERLESALAGQWPDAELADRLTADGHVLAILQSALAADDGQVTVALRDGRRVVAIWPGLRTQALGLAVDIGSTTLSAHLVDLATGWVQATASMMNPQIRFGEDVMSRVSYVQMNADGQEALTGAIRQAVADLAREAAARADIAAGEVLDLVVFGNPVMHHLFFGFDPRPLGTAPFALVTDGALTWSAADLNLPLHPGARVYALPCVAGHVGADTAAVILAEAPDQADQVTLIVDVGTNAELVLGDRQRLLAASSPTGPAFEGAQISGGQRAAPGAIERVRIDRTSGPARFKVIGCPLWSDTPGFAAATGVTGICGSGIVEAIAEMYLAGLLTADGIIDGRHAGRVTGIVAEGRTFSFRLNETVTITQNDVRAIQLAKAALYAGARLLMDALAVTRVERIVLAGAFGSQIDPLYAMVLGMLPDCDPAAMRAAGNAAGTGAVMALLDRHARPAIETTVRRVEKIETAVAPAFQEHFVAAMAFPHGLDNFPRLAQAIDLPAPPTPTRRRRRR